MANTLKNHETIHHNTKSVHKCKPCGKSFTQKGGLKRHIDTIHKGHKDYKCDSLENQSQR